MYMSKWYKLKSRNFQGISELDFMPPELAQEYQSGSYMAKGSEAHCLQIKAKLESLNYPGELYMEECEPEGKISPKEPNLPDFNKEIVKKSQEILEGMGYTVKTGHLYELFSQLAGFKSWNVAKVKGAKFIKLITESIQPGYYSFWQYGTEGFARILEVKQGIAHGFVYFDEYMHGIKEPVATHWDAETGENLQGHDIFNLENQITKEDAPEFFAGLRPDGTPMTREEYDRSAYNTFGKIVQTNPNYKNMGNGWHHHHSGSSEFYGLTSKELFLQYVNSGAPESCPFPTAVPVAGGGMDYYLPSSNLPAGRVTDSDIEGIKTSKKLAYLEVIRNRVE